jgi:Transposase DDE domain
MFRRFTKYTKKVYNMQDQIHKIPDPRRDARIPISSVCAVLFLAFCLRVKSLNQLNNWVRTGRIKKVVPQRMRIAFVDTMRRVLSELDPSSLRDILRDVILKARKNNVFRNNTIGGMEGVGGLSVVAIDGVELFSTKNQGKSCEECLTRTTKDGETEYYHKAVVCMTVGDNPRVCLGIETLCSKQDGSDKDEGELTGAKRLVDNLHQSLHRFADIIVVDALYANEPFLSKICSLGMDVVVRMKNERLNIMKDARGLFENREPDYTWIEQQGKESVLVEVWHDSFSFGTFDRPLYMYRFKETILSQEGQKKTQTSEKPESKEIWVATTSERFAPKKSLDTTNPKLSESSGQDNAQLLRTIMQKRWDIENCGFHQLKTYCNIDHCFIHNPNAIICTLLMTLISFNLFHIFLFCSTHHFDKWNLTRIAVIEEMKLEAFAGEAGRIWLLNRGPT